jgi:hypothetical protein
MPTTPKFLGDLPRPNVDYEHALAARARLIDRLPKIDDVVGHVGQASLSAVVP